MKNTIRMFAASLAMMTATAAFAGDPSVGEKEFKKCKSCHSIVSDDGEVIFKGGKNGPNLYGIIGAKAGQADYKYSKALKKLGETDHVWDEASLAAFITNPKAWLVENGIKDKTKMSFKMRKKSEDVAAYLATLTK